MDDSTDDLSSTSSFEIELPSTSASSGEELRLTMQKRVLQYPRGGWKRSRDHALPHARLYILLIEKLFLLQRQVAC